MKYDLPRAFLLDLSTSAHLEYSLYEGSAAQFSLADVMAGSTATSGPCYSFSRAPMQ
jgi:hypothetical protein